MLPPGEGDTRYECFPHCAPYSETFFSMYVLSHLFLFHYILGFILILPGFLGFCQVNLFLYSLNTI